jgi:hypothetical protein
VAFSSPGVKYSGLTKSLKIATDVVTITVIVTGRSSGKITRKNTPKPEQPSMMAASSSSRGIAAMNARKSRMTKDMLNAISTRMRPGRLLNRPRLCSTQIVGTTAGGMIKPDNTSALTRFATLPGLRCRTKATIEQSTMRTATDTTVRMIEFWNAVTSR